ncbi:hypothetical protein TNCV_2851551 [Trichonephila clavipes]|nr:hypothetical protein TNCV_2851551 [Trichonephila clavipes]
MASSSQCPLFPKPRKGKGKSPANNLKRNANTTPVTPGLLYSKVLNSNSKHQMSAPGLASSASEKSENIKNNSSNKETLNVFHKTLQAILAISKPSSKCKRFLPFFPLFSPKWKNLLNVPTQLKN